LGDTKDIVKILCHLSPKLPFWKKRRKKTQVVNQASLKMADKMVMGRFQMLRLIIILF